MKWIKRILVGILLIGILLFVAYLFLNKPHPEGTKGPKAEALAQKMLKAVNKDAWDSIGVIQWDFMGMHKYVWDKDRHLARVDWDDNSVLVNLNTIKGKAWQKEQEIKGEEGEKMVQKAWEYFCNDSFWLNAVVKAVDPGTERSIVKMDDGTDALLVSYSSGGVTPGDSYLWILDENGQPKSWQMWVSIIPIGGLEFSWENWTTLPTGAKVAELHKGQLFDINISDLKASNSLVEFGFKEDPFISIVR